MDFFDKQNQIFFEFLNDLFEFKKHKTWDDLSKSITEFKIKRTYRKFAELFPRKYDYSNELTKLNTNFSTIHYSKLRGRSIINEIVRFSLYSEKIIVFHPLQNPAVTNHKFDPRKNSLYWLSDFLEALYFYITIQKWVKVGIVKLIINPCEYDFELRDDIDRKIAKRAAKIDFSKIQLKDFEETQMDIAEKFAVDYLGQSKETIVANLLSMVTPKFSPDEADDFAERIIKSFPFVNPLNKEANKKLRTQKSMINTKSGGSLESILYVSELTEGHIYTTSNLTWNQLKDIGHNDFWSKTSKLYSDLPLNFLNNVDTAFALDIREQERLSGVRSQIKKIYSELNSITLNNLSEGKMHLLHEEFVDELKKAEAEWEDINQQAQLQRKSWLALNVGIPIIKNDVSILPIFLTSLVVLYGAERSISNKRKIQRVKNPISVFVDLKNQQEDFFTVLKNCLI